MATHAEVESFNVSQLCDFVSNKLQDVVADTEDVVDELRTIKITGRAFLRLTSEELWEMIRPVGDRKALSELKDSYKAPAVVCYYHQVVCGQ